MAVLRDADLVLQAARLIPCQEAEAAQEEVSDWLELEVVGPVVAELRLEVLLRRCRLGC